MCSTALHIHDLMMDVLGYKLAGLFSITLFAYNDVLGHYAGVPSPLVSAALIPRLNDFQDGWS